MTRASQKGSKRKRQKTGLNRSMLDVGIGGFRQAIKYKVEEAGGMFVKVPTKKVKPSQTCPKCLHQKKKDSRQRAYIAVKTAGIRNRGTWRLLRFVGIGF